LDTTISTTASGVLPTAGGQSYLQYNVYNGLRFGGREAYLRPARNRQTLRPGVALKLVEVHALAAEALAKRKWV
jgi:hypothetical protein